MTVTAAATGSCASAVVVGAEEPDPLLVSLSMRVRSLSWPTAPSRVTFPLSPCRAPDPPLLLRNEQRGKKVDGERCTLVLTGKWQGKQLELHTVQKIFRLQTGFRLRQELPDFW